MRYFANPRIPVCLACALAKMSAVHAAEPVRSPPRTVPPLPAGFSIYLDLIRWVAATLVMLYHLREEGFGSRWVNAHLPGNGHAYVTIFFVLSGFVISFTNERKQHLGAREYIKDRVARIYSVAIPVLLLCLAATFLFEPGPLDREYGFALDHPFLSTAVNAVFLGNVWFQSLPPYLDGPYWSLSYEVLYYAIFGAWVFARSRWAWVIGLALVAGPKILLLFPCWLVGVWLDRHRERWALTPRAALIVAVIGLLTPVLMYAAGVFGVAKLVSAWVLGAHYGAFSNSVNFASDYLTAIAFATHLYGVYWLRPSIPAWLAAFARWGASIAFSLYLFHMPVLQVIKRWLGGGVASNLALGGTVVAITVVCYVLALVTEQKRAALKRLL